MAKQQVLKYLKIMNSLDLGLLASDAAPLWKMGKNGWSPVPGIQNRWSLAYNINQFFAVPHT